MKYKKEEEFEIVNMFKKGVYNEMYKEYFNGDSFLNPLVKPGELPLFLANVTF